MTRFRIFIGLTLSISLPATAQQRPTSQFPLTNPAGGPFVLANELEGRFNDFLSTCKIALPLRIPRGLLGAVGLSRREISAIDPEIIRALHLTDTPTPTTLRPVTSSLGTAFGYMWTAAEERDFKPNWDPIQVLPVAEATLGTTPVSGLPDIVLYSTCGSTLTGNFSISAEPPFPIGTLAAALNAETSRTQDARLVVMDGVFRNPLWQMWLSPDVDAAQTDFARRRAALVFWAWRTRPGQGSAAVRVLVQFEGTHIFRSLRSTQQLNADARVAAGLSFAVVNLSTTVQGSASQGTELTLSDYRLLVRAGGAGPAPIFADLPPAADIAAVVGSSELPVEYESNQVDAAQPLRFDLLFPALPAAYCGPGQWQVLGGGPEDRNRYVIEGPPILDSAAGACRFKVRFTPASTTSPVDGLQPRLASMRSIAPTDATAGEPVRLLVPIRLSLTRAPVPDLSFVNEGTPAYTALPTAPSTTSISVRYNFTLGRMGSYANATVNTDDIRLTCTRGMNGSPVNWAPVTLTGSGANRGLELVGTSIYQGVIPANPPLQRCSLSGEFQITRQGANYAVPVPIRTIEVNFPAPPATPEP